MADFFGPDYDPASEILVTVGVSEAIDVALRAVLNPGDKVLYHEPCYVSYAPSVSLAFGEAIPVGTTPENDFALDPAAFEKTLDSEEEGVYVGWAAIDDATLPPAARAVHPSCG